MITFDISTEPEVEVSLVGATVVAGVDSVNGKTGVVVLDATDVGALPDDTQIPSKTSDLVNDSGFLTEHQSLSAYRTSADQDLIDATKVDKVEGSSLMSSAEHTKLAGIEAGAEVNVNADWNAESGDAQILNKPTLGTASEKDVPASGDASTTQVVMGNDTRLTDARTPVAHTHDDRYYTETETDTLLTDKVSYQEVQKVANALGLRSWNQQLIPDQSSRTAWGSVTVTKQADGSYIFNGTVTSADAYTFYMFSTIQGHKDYICGIPSVSSNDDFYCSVYSHNSSDFNVNGYISNATATGTTARIICNAKVGKVFDNYHFKPMIVDLTILCGAGNEFATAESFRNIFSADYYPYCTGIASKDEVAQKVAYTDIVSSTGTATNKAISQKKYTDDQTAQDTSITNLVNTVSEYGLSVVSGKLSITYEI